MALPLPAPSPAEIKEIRETNGLSHKVFALHVGVSERLIRRWESGESVPRGAERKMLSLIKTKGLSVLDY